MLDLRINKLKVKWSRKSLRWSEFFARLIINLWNTNVDIMQNKLYMLIYIFKKKNILFTCVCCYIIEMIVILLNIL